MSTIHYFPRYSQKENMVTNNTLLLFSRLYNHSPDMFRLFINEMLEESEIELDTTVLFKQQEKTLSGTIPDGFIEQESFKVVIETKLYGQEPIKQLKGHLDAFDNEDKQIVLLINKEPISKEYYIKIMDAIEDYNNKNNLSIDFASTTFKKICRAFEGVKNEYDFEMTELVNDYEAFCNETGLIDNTDTKIRVVLTGKTFEQNKKYNIYYQKRDRGYQNSKYLGLYKKKAVRAVGEITSVIDADINSDTVKNLEVVQGTVTEEMKKNIAIVTIEAKDKYGYELNKNHRFFFVKEYHDTEYKKRSKGGLMGTRYIDLEDLEDEEESSKEMSVSDIAELLKDKVWDV